MAWLQMGVNVGDLIFFSFQKLIRRDGCLEMVTPWPKCRTIGPLTLVRRSTKFIMLFNFPNLGQKNSLYKIPLLPPPKFPSSCDHNGRPHKNSIYTINVLEATSCSGGSVGEVYDESA